MATFGRRIIERRLYLFS